MKRIVVGLLVVIGIATHSAFAMAAPTHHVACPAGIPTQTITVVNQANVRPFALAKVERAVVDQSMQLRAAWSTPCVVFGGGGWLLYLKIGHNEPHGEHFYYGAAYAIIWTDGLTEAWWSGVFSHEVLEMLEDPTLTTRYVRDGSTWQREIADPVKWDGYSLDAVYVSDFVFPAWYAGATNGADVWCARDTCVDRSPLIAPSNAPGPYDQRNALTAPWQTPASHS